MSTSSSALVQSGLLGGGAVTPTDVRSIVGAAGGAASPMRTQAQTAQAQRAAAESAIANRAKTRAQRGFPVASAAAATPGIGRPGVGIGASGPGVFPIPGFGAQGPVNRPPYPNAGVLRNWLQNWQPPTQPPQQPYMPPYVPKFLPDFSSDITAATGIPMPLSSRQQDEDEEYPQTYYNPWLGRR